MRKTIIPAIIAKSQKELNQRISKVSDHATLLQLDIMDGSFVPNHSIDFDFELPKNHEFEAHLMIKNPEEWIDKNWGKVHTILVHIESCRDPESTIRFVKDKRKMGFALNPETPLEKITRYLDEIDQVLIMTVNPGFYGSEFLSGMLNKVEELRRMKPDLDIEVDGGINLKTITEVDEAGANMFVSGSYIMKSQNVQEAIERLKDLLEDEEYE